jgi:branched-chain amino acid transport system substrate-binding protein
LTRLITVDKADFLLVQGGEERGLIYQDIASEHKIISLLLHNSQDTLTERVLDNYERYKYFFRSGVPNATSAIEGMVDSIVACREHTGYNKIAFVYHDIPRIEEDFFIPITDALVKKGFEVVYETAVQLDSVDFTSYFVRAESSGAEILYPFIFGPAGISFVKEYTERESPMVMWGGVAMGSMNDFWNVTDGKCEYISLNAYPVVTGYPLTSKTLKTNEYYCERWGQGITPMAASAYDALRFVLFDAIKQAGTIEPERVIEKLEEIDVETSLARHFIFTESHDVFVGKGGPNRLSEDYMLVALFQWQNGLLVPVYPIELMDEVGATYVFPRWSGPWDNLG